MQSFRKALRRWRKNKTQEQAAAKLGVPYGTYVNWEQGINTPATFTRAKVMELINGK